MLGILVSEHVDELDALGLVGEGFQAKTVGESFGRIDGEHDSFSAGDCAAQADGGCGRGFADASGTDADEQARGFDQCSDGIV